LEATIDKVAKCSASLARRKKRTKRARIQALQQRIQLAEIQLQRDPANEEVRSILLEFQGNLVETFQNQVAHNHHLLAASWFRYGNTCSKQFFDLQEKELCLKS
jgi:hypothetical protein